MIPRIAHGLLLVVERAAVLACVSLSLLACGAAPPPVAARCVDPYADLDGRLARDGIQGPPPGAPVEHDPMIDLDGDGDLDRAISREGLGGSGGQEWSLYLVEGACALPAGTIFGRALAVVDHQGVRAIETEIWGGSSSQELVRFVVHPGAEIQVLARRECVPVEDPSGHYAQISSCERDPW